MLLSHILSLVGCALTGLQAFLILYQGDGICLNQGCEIVDSLTRIPPLYFNIAGFLFFLLVSFGISQARKGSELWQRFTGLLLLAALAAEAVLICFQYLITDIFCSYCLIVFSLIVLINIFMGLKQTFRGIFIFSAACLAFASLDFTIEHESEFTLDDGTLASFNTDASDRQLYLFFSSTCDHCEEVLGVMKDELSCNVKFHPVDQVTSFTFPNITPSRSYDPQVNVDFLKHLGIKEIPVIADINQTKTVILTGQKAIVEYLRDYCQPKRLEQTTELPSSQSSNYSFPLPEKEDGCSVDENCEEESSSALSSEQSLAVPQAPERADG